MCPAPHHPPVHRGGIIGRKPAGECAWQRPKKKRVQVQESGVARFARVMQVSYPYFVIALNDHEVIISDGW